MRVVVYWAVAAMIAAGLGGCGNKGKLKSPSEIQHQQEKEELKAAKRKENTPPPVDKNAD